MDRITKSLLEEFSRESGLSHHPDEDQFEHLAAYLTAGRHVGESFDTGDIVTGSGGDTGIDAIATIVNGALVSDPELVEELSGANGYLDASFIFVQAERSSGFDAAKIGTFTFGVVDFFADSPKLPRNSAVKAAAEVMSAVLSRASRFKRGNPTCRLYYVTTGTWTNDPTLEARRKASIEDLERLRLFREVEFIPIDANALQKLYQQAKNALASVSFNLNSGLDQARKLENFQKGLDNVKRLRAFEKGIDQMKKFSKFYQYQQLIINPGDQTPINQK